MFASREDAGRRLGNYLLERGLQPDVVLGLPRGGVVVADQAARILQAPLGVLIVRKIGHPFHREFAVGAIAEHDVTVFDEKSLAAFPGIGAELANIIEEEKARLHEYQQRFHGPASPKLAGRTVLLVDDGLATGATTEAAVRSARKQGAAKVLVGVPVASVSAVKRLENVSDQVLALFVDPDFDAVGRYYDVFGQTTDAEVLHLLAAA
jgi:predicted phosphoribosyltransferase